MNNNEIITIDLKKLAVTDKCPYCGNNTLIEIAKGDKIMLTCAFPECEKYQQYIKWVSKYYSEQRRRLNKVLEDINYCEICKRKREELKTDLEEHHIFEFESNPGLDNDPNNRMKVCNHCHTIIHAIRRIAGTEDRKKEDLA